ncbi:chaperone protein dnaJ 1, mitochondrial isoform X7 [Rosa chinensis]|uniref:chaperone protein dnaJ 1, mitochondrial isoform X7 n=1 Tax=Rosa chinensis TaxID=74649 RepID=UPI001AD93455|nr:chaperone protein dnaJ 1, mitochondrial isoform X7 [Rosa chinensis]
MRQGFAAHRNETTTKLLAFLGAQAKMRLRRLFARHCKILKRGQNMTCNQVGILLVMQKVLDIIIKHMVLLLMQRGLDMVLNLISPVHFIKYSQSCLILQIFEHEFDQVAPDIQVELSLSFSEAARGCTKNLSVTAHVPCDSCDGRGYPLKAKTKVCPICRGIGRVTIPPFTSTCSTCKGSGQIIKEHCMSCGGLGIVEGAREVEVTIPAGVDSGDTIRVPEAGNSGPRGSQPGWLYIKLKVAEDPVFVRDGADVYVDSNISFTQAILGGKVEVPTLTGKTEVKIPKGVQPGEHIVLRGKGLPKHGFLVHHGDQYVRFRVQFPTKINERQHAILEEFVKEEIIHGNSNSNDTDWFQRIIERVMGQRFVLNFSIFLLILFLLSKTTG